MMTLDDDEGGSVGCSDDKEKKIFIASAETKQQQQ